MKIIYHCFIYLYPLVARIISIKNKKAKLWVGGRRNIFSRLTNLVAHSKGNLVWMHCASLGEYEQGLPIIQAIQNGYPKYQVLVTFFSPSGYEVKKNSNDGVLFSYLPMDNAQNAKEFLAIVKPRLVLFVKYEFWSYYLHEVKKHSIPLILVSGIFRPNQFFFHWYGGFYRQMLDCFDILFVQNEESVALLKQIGFVKQVFISGDTRFDRVMTIAKRFEPIEPIEKFINQHLPIIVAGSTWKADDELLSEIAKRHSDYQLIIAPHQITEFRIEECLKLYPQAISYTDYLSSIMQDAIANRLDLEKHKAAPRVLIINNIGLLSKLYAYATVCYVGGGFGSDGVHNVLEAAVYNKPVIIGTEYSKYDEAKGLVAEGGCVSVNNIDEFDSLIQNWLVDENMLQYVGSKAGDFVKKHAGATEKIMEYLYINRLLTN